LLAIIRFAFAVAVGLEFFAPLPRHRLRAGSDLLRRCLGGDLFRRFGGERGAPFRGNWPGKRVTKWSAFRMSVDKQYGTNVNVIYIHNVLEANKWVSFS
jgi:hypothetical protein